MIQFLLLASLSAIAPTSRPTPKPDILVTAAWLRTHVNDPNLVVLDLTMSGMDSPDPYESGHIPGARKLDFHSIFTGDGSNGALTMQLVPADSLRKVFETLGVSDGSTIVLYSTSRWLSPVARAYVTLDYIGLGDRTHILDGGYDAWKAAGGASAMTAPSFARGSLHVTTRKDAVADGAYVRAHLADASMTIVDARAPEFYNGSAKGHSAARAGHVPGARNVYFLTLADSVTNVYLTPEQARARFTAAGVSLDKPVVVYCHIGQTASVDYVQLRRLGVPVRLYDGSFEDWSRHSDYPVASGVDP
ncbi:MAG: sulfurtransferase [Gemmatimonadota bacterium]